MPASKKEAKEFVKRWQKRLAAIPAGSNNEQQDTQKFWVDLLINVLGIPSNTIDSFVDFDRRLAAIMTDDYFSITLPSSLDANEATGPTWWGFVAAQVVLGAKALFSTAPLSQLLLTGSSGSKKALDKHHLFPDNYLKAKGYLSQRSNRGNFTLVDYQNNIYISDDAPNEYVRRYRAALGEDEYRRNCEEHALPVGFEDLDYEEFLGKRRQLMGELVKGAYERL